MHDAHTRWPALEVAVKRARLQAAFRFFPGRLGEFSAGDISTAARASTGLRLRDPRVWSPDPAIQRSISNRLGWLNSPALMADALPHLEAFASTIRAAGFTDVVLLGMGGSSLAPEVLRAILGIRPGWPRLQMLDSTDPAAVRAAATPLDRTLFVLASKSGTTIEPNSLAAHFRHQLAAEVARWSDHFIAITDEDTELAQLARRERFRELFINPSDIGGRYSALSYFGLVPAALMGQDVGALVGWGLAMLSACDPDGDVTANPGAALGLAMGAAARSGRDKLTLLLPRALEPLGLWVEQLVAESTGKEGKGIVPIAGEPPGKAADYGPDRFFVRVGEPADEILDAAREARLAGAPLGEIDLPEPAALGAEFVRWEVATAIASALLGVNPFDEPNVKQAKDATAALIDQHAATGALPRPSPDRTTADGIALTLSSAARTLLGGRGAEAFLTLLREGDYLALLAFLPPEPDLAARLNPVRAEVRQRTRAATMWAYGPRYLHSTGQLHKGGPNSGVFMLITATPREDLPIPDRPFTFGTLELAQALGDFTSLDLAGRRALHVHLPAPDLRLLTTIADALVERLGAVDASQERA